MAKPTTIVKSIVSAGAGLLLALRVIWPSAIPSDALSLGLLIAVILPWIAAFIDAAELPGGWKFTFRELKDEQVRQKGQIDGLRFLVSHFVTKDELVHLRKLAANDEFRYHKADRFVAELRRLRDMGLICRNTSTGIADLPESGSLKDYVSITELGRDYLRLRR
ncbi:MAG: hypothetical protein ABSG53_00700 [Thermoguttaceae bacterium]|jgi:hypothetical protein